MSLSRQLTKLAAFLNSNGLMSSLGLQPDAQFVGFKNRFMNSSLLFDQRAAAAGITIPSSAWTYCLDRWACYSHVAGKFSVARSADVPSDQRIPFSLLFTSLSAYTPAVGEYCGFKQGIEGLNVADLAWGTSAAKPATLSFWVKSSVAGNFGGCFYNSDANRSYPYGYTVNAVNTWEKKSITVAGDTTGNWDKTTNAGILVDWVLGAGSTHNNSASSAWGSGWNHLSSNTNLLATNGATLRVAGMQFEPGTVATAFDVREIGAEWDMVRRYFVAESDGAAYRAILSGTTYPKDYYMPMVLPVAMRAAPTVVTTEVDLHKPGIVFEAIAGKQVSVGGNRHFTVMYTATNAHTGCYVVQPRAFGYTASAEI